MWGERESAWVDKHTGRLRRGVRMGRMFEGSKGEGVENKVQDWGMCSVGEWTFGPW